MRLTIRWGLFGTALLVAGCVASGPESELPVVSTVDLERYAGTWYEMARLPMWFQRGCVSSQARYEPIDADTLAVANSCSTADGGHKRATGRAYVVDPDTNAKLEVVFDNWFSRLFPFLARGKYWIIYLDSEYQSAIVGQPNREYLWILARTPSIGDSRYRELVQFAAARGFDTAKLIRSGD